jgi:hypothetical protein
MRFRSVLSALLLAAYLSACMSYQATSQPVAELTAAPQSPEHVQVTTISGYTFVVDAPRVVHDTLFGTTGAVDARGAPSTRTVALPLAELRSVDVRKFDVWGTLVLVGGVVGVSALLAVAASNAMDDAVQGMSFSR